MRAPLGAPRQLASQLNAATQAPGPRFLGRGNVPVPVQRAPRGGVIMPPVGSRSLPGAGLRAPPAGAALFSISETSREDALNEPSGAYITAIGIKSRVPLSI